LLSETSFFGPVKRFRPTTVYSCRLRDQLGIPVLGGGRKLWSIIGTQPEGSFW
jgi:hypothetical protein